MIEAFLFDIGNVLLDFDYLKEFRRLFDEETAQEIANASVRKAELWKEMDAGRISYEEALALIIREAPHLHQQIPVAIDALYDQVEAFEYAESWLGRIKAAGFRIYILSNYGQIPFDKSKARMPFLKYTDGALLSWEVKRTKPDPTIFEEACRRFLIEPEKTVFVDDSAANVAAAAAMGFHTVLFTDYESAVKQITDLGCAI